MSGIQGVEGAVSSPQGSSPTSAHACHSPFSTKGLPCPLRRAFLLLTSACTWLACHGLNSTSCCSFPIGLTPHGKPRPGFWAQISEQVSLIGSCGKHCWLPHPTTIPPTRFCSGVILEAVAAILQPRSKAKRMTEKRTEQGYNSRR